MSKVAFISGASSGFGEACARYFASSGYSLVLIARRSERLTSLANELSVKTSVYCQILDVRSNGDVQACIEGLPEGFRNIDVLINNAGLALGTGPAFEANIEDWDVMIDTNIKGLTYLTRHVLPGMVSRNSGHIINIGSTAGSWPYPGGNTYCGTKAFVEQFTRCLKADVLGKNIKVSCISPGMAETEFSVVRMNGDEQKAKDVYKGTEPLSASDIAEIALWIASTPSHVNINHLEVMPICQSWGPLSIVRNESK